MSKENMDSLLRYRIGSHATLELVQGDIIHETTDAIVNAANSSLLGGGGVDGAIHRAAGSRLLEECRKIRDQRGSLAPGQAVATGAGSLKVRYVIHTVGPVWQGGGKNEPQILESCYCHCVEEARRLGCAEISFPSISTGAFGYPLAEAAQIALRSIADLLYGSHVHSENLHGQNQPSSQPLNRVRFVLFDPHTHAAYAKAAKNLAAEFPHYEIRTVSNA
jgi:O-acetyl-ADP-ribose deacetylase (regulator of RNase III)